MKRLQIEESEATSPTGESRGQRGHGVQAATRSDRTTGRQFRDRGEAAFAAEDFVAAEASFASAVAIAGNDPWTWLWLGRAQLARGSATEASGAASRALELRPGWSRATELLADALLARQDDDAIEELLEFSGERAGDAKFLARVLTELLDRDAADGVRTIAILLHRAQPRGQLLRKEINSRIERGDSRRAEMILTSLPDSPVRAAIVETVVRWKLRQDLPGEAWTLLSTIPNPALRDGLLEECGAVLWRNGHVDEALQAYDLATEHSDRASPWRERDAVHGETAVLKGEWRPLQILPRRLDSMPGRVLHVVRTALPYVEAGYSIRTHSIALAQRDSGLDPHVVSRFGFPAMRGITGAPLNEDIEGIPYHRLAPDATLPDRMDDEITLGAAALLAVTEQIRPAVLHAASDFHNAMSALEVGRITGLPVVYEVRGFWEETWLAKRGAVSTDAQMYTLRRDRELEMMQRADRVVTLSDGMRDAIVGRGIPAGKVVVVPNAVDTDAFVPLPRDEALATELGLTPGDAVLGYISSFNPYEGIDYLIDAIARLADQGRRVRGLLVGDGSQLGPLQAQAERLGLSDRILFTGRVPHADVLRYYSLIDVFVIPRTADRVSQLVTPLKPLEAMATGRAVVVSGVDALRGMVIEGETGLVFRAEDADDLVSVVTPLLDDSTRRETLGRVAREWVVANRTWRQNGQRYLELYRSMGVPV